MIDVEADLALARRLADAARGVALSHFRAGVNAENKAAAGPVGAGFDPVTIADREAEAAMRALLAEARPDDAVIGEEGEDRPGRSGRTWILDPIDGTRAFIAGLPTWCVLIALCDEAGPALSVIDQPHIGERFLGVATPDRREARLERAGGAAGAALRADAHARLDAAILSSTDPHLFKGAEADAFHAVRRRARLVRYGLDAYAYAALALGGVQLVIESGLKAWDLAALAPVVRGAGGVFTDWSGAAPGPTGQVVAAANPALHAEALALLAPAAARRG